MEAFNLTYTLVNNINHNNEFLRLFKQTAFLIYRNIYGGLNEADSQALDSIKRSMLPHIQEQDKAYLTRLIDALSLYDLPYVLTKVTYNAILEKELYSYISNQSHIHLCEILAEHVSKDNSIHISFKNEPESLEQVQNLINVVINHPPIDITEPPIRACNVWHEILQANELPDDHIHIIFYADIEEVGNFLCLKGLYRAEAYFQSIQTVSEEIVRQEKYNKPFEPTFAQGIVTLASKVFGSKISSKVRRLEVVDVNASSKNIDDPPQPVQPLKTDDEEIQVTGVSSAPTKKEGEEEGWQIDLQSQSYHQENTNLALLEALSGQNKEESYQSDQLTPLSSQIKGQGHYDVEMGYLFIIT